MEVDDAKPLKFKHPFTLITAELSGSGKILLVRDTLNNFETCIADLESDIIKVVWTQGKW
jgi:hypothetical protein